MSQQYYSFDELKGELGLSEDEIKRMVSEGELRAFRDEDTMKFKREDVEALRRANRPGGMDDDDIILLDDDEPEVSSGRGDLTEELVLEDDDDFQVGRRGGALDTQDTFVEGEVGGVTEPIEVIDDEDEEDMIPAAATGSRRMASPRPSASRRLAASAPSSALPWVTGVQIALCAVLLYGGFLMYGLLADSNTPATRWLTDQAYEFFHKAPPAKRTLGDGR